MKSKLVKSIVLLLSLTLLAGCGGGNPAESSSQEGEFINYLEDERVRLPVDYKGHNFFIDGVAKAQVVTYIDGDTVHFKNEDETLNPEIDGVKASTIKARFYGVDTPESTGTIEPYGRGASNFTKTTLKKAAANGTIVVSSLKETYGEPERDGTTSRYLCLVWYNTEVKDCDYKDLRLLNLALVQNGWSMTRSLDRFPEFKTVFLLAERQARNHKLNMFSGVDDPDYNYGGYEDTSILAIKREQEKNVKDKSYRNAFDNKKVSFRGTVAGYASNTLYVQAFFTEEQGARYPEGEYASINIYGGPSGIPNPDFTQVGAYVEIRGTGLQHDTFGFQISSARFPLITTNTRKNDCKVLITADENTDCELYTFEKTAAEFDKIAYNDQSDARFDAMYSRVHFTDIVTVDHAYQFEGGDFELTLKAPEGSEHNTLRLKINVGFVYYLDHENQTGRLHNEEAWKGKKFKVSGVYYPRRTKSGNLMWSIAPGTWKDLVYVPEAQ